MTILYLGFSQDNLCILALYTLSNFVWTNDSKILFFPGSLAQKQLKLHGLQLITFYLEGFSEK